MCVYHLICYSKLIAILISRLFSFFITIINMVSKENKEELSSNNKWKKSRYLAVNIEDKVSYISNKILPGLEIILEFIKENQKDLTENIEEIESIITVAQNFINNKKTEKYTIPHTFHITTYFKGKTKWDESNLAFKQFIENKSISIKAFALVVVPSRIVTLAVIPDCFVNNKYPHITTILGSYSAYDSNTVLNEIFDEKLKLEDYKDLKVNSVFYTKLSLKDLSEQVYVCLYKDSVLDESFNGNFKGLF